MVKDNNKSAQFFERLVSYGGISTDSGIIYMWGDPDVLIPAEAFARLQEKLIEKLGKEGKDLIIWAGKISGFQSSEVLGEKFGIPFIKIWADNHEDIDNLINGATQDGLGLIKAIDYPKNNKNIKFSLSGTDCNVSQKTLELLGKKDEGRDLFVMGIMLGGAEFLYKKSLSINEKTCICMGQKDCIFNLEEGDQTKLLSTLFKKVNINQIDLEKKIRAIYLKRPSKGSFLNAKKIQFGDGNFIFSGLKGTVAASRVMAPFFEYLKKRLSPKDHLEVLEEFSKGYLTELFKNLPETKTKTTKDILKIIEKLNLLGLGEFKLVNSTNKLVFIENKTNPIVQDRKIIFGLSKNPTDDFISVLLKSVFEKFYKTKIEVQELECISMGKPRCLFKIILD